MLNQRKKFSVVITLGALGLSSAAWAEDTPADSGLLSVTVTNIQNAKGQIGCSLYASKDGFPSEPEKAKAQMFVEQRDGKATCTFKGVKPGTYAVSVMHDENKDGQLETSLVGRPKEWWGVSNDVPAERFGPPKYEKASFKYAGSAKTIRVKLQL
jgi:uncharacterized protein (DUF2141 family)